MENKYQITKTIRFGLTKKRSNKKNESHKILDDLLRLSEDKIKKEAKHTIDNNEEKLIKVVSDCTLQISEYISNWNSIKNRIDQISLTKDYYRIISKKARFDGFWKDSKGIKQPQSQSIKVSSLRSIYNGKKRMVYIEEYWAENISKAQKFLFEFNPILEQYQNALKDKDKSHTKPQLVGFRKLFLSLCNVINETLIPLVYNSIEFKDLEKLSDDSQNDMVRYFASKEMQDERQLLYDNIKKIKEYFECNGGYVSWGRVTLNKYTTQQKPYNFKSEIAQIINKLQIVKLFQELKEKKDNEIIEYFQNKNKFENLKNNDISIVERAQMFKCKSIPASVRFALADYLQINHSIERNDSLHFFQVIGAPVSPSWDYSKLRDDEKDNFSLEKYPIKLAFDYAWENMAREIKAPGVKFPKKICECFLKEKFDIDTTTVNFKLYADLLYIKDCLNAIEPKENSVKDRDSFITKIKETFGQITYPNNDKIGSSECTYKKFENYILNWIDKSEEEQKKEKKNNTQAYNDYDKAKQKLGLLRGSQKNEINKYPQLTKEFKKIASCFGKNFADLRDKFREEYELNKISHGALILEDENNDKYVLLQKILNEDKDKEELDIYVCKNEGELNTYQVKSLTSKTLLKLVKNKGAYKDFHSSNKNADINKIIKKWGTYKNEKEFLDYLKDCLVNSKMAKEQNWDKFKWNLDSCNTYEEIEKEINLKSYKLQGTDPKDKYKITIEKVKDLVENKDSLLLPIVNQDITSITRTNKNQFSKDWQMIFDNKNKKYRLHPEFSIVYRQPTPDYPKPGEKRYSRFQIIANMQCEIFPQDESYISKKEQIHIFNEKDSQENEVRDFNEKIKKNITNGNFYVIGIDRGIKQLATLCVLNKQGEIQGDFEIYTRHFDNEKKEWVHELLRKDGILDLSNLRVETTITGDKVLVDLSSIKTKDAEGNLTKDNLQTIKLKQLSYIRKLQYRMQYDKDNVNKFIKENTTEEQIRNNIGNLIYPYKEGAKFADLPINTFKNMFERYKECCDKNDEKGKIELCELDAADKLKNGIVANMIGVIVFLLKKYEYKVFISLENLCRAYHCAINKMTGQCIPSSFLDSEIDFKEQENLVLAGVGTYRFFEMQLLKKLFKMQTETKVENFVPAFRSVDNYEKIVRSDKKTDNVEYINYPFGIVSFVDPKNTSKKCPECGSVLVSRVNNVIKCKECNYSTTNSKNNSHLGFIKNGDDNGAYHIAKKTFINLTKQQPQ